MSLTRLTVFAAVVLVVLMLGCAPEQDDGHRRGRTGIHRQKIGRQGTK